MITKLYQRLLDRKEMFGHWKTSVLVPIYKGKVRCDKLQCIWRSEVIRTWNDDG